MTQAPPQPYPTSTATPAQGAPATPVVVSSGVLATVPVPTAASSAGSQPVPWTRGWVVLLNSSPFTLLVSSGGPVTQIAAFTSDKVYVLTTGTPVTVLPQPGSGTSTPTQDSTVYATWYHDEPPGTYPAALGSGSATFSAIQSLIPFTTGALIAGASQAFPAAGGSSTLGWGGLSMIARETTNNGPLVVRVTWLDKAVAGNSVGIRTFIVPALGTATVSMPHLGPFVSITVKNNLGVANAYQITVSQTTIALDQWNVQSGNAIDGQSMIVPAAGPLVGAGAQVLVGRSLVTYGGPATLHAWITSVGVAAGCGVFIFYTDSTGANVVLSGMTFPAGGALGTFPPAVSLIVPPFPLSLQAFNTTAAGVVINASLVADDWRMAA